MGTSQVQSNRIAVKHFYPYLNAMTPKKLCETVMLDRFNGQINYKMVFNKARPKRFNCLTLKVLGMFDYN